MVGDRGRYSVVRGSSKQHTRNVVLALAVVPGLLYGLAWLAYGQYAGSGFGTHLGLRVMGAVLATAACNLAWRLVRNTNVGAAFTAYVSCFVLTLGLAWLLLAS